MWSCQNRNFFDIGRILNSVYFFVSFNVVFLGRPKSTNTTPSVEGTSTRGRGRKGAPSRMSTEMSEVSSVVFSIF